LIETGKKSFQASNCAYWFVLVYWWWKSGSAIANIKRPRDIWGVYCCER